MKYFNEIVAKLGFSLKSQEERDKILSQLEEEKKLNLYKIEIQKEVDDILSAASQGQNISQGFKTLFLYQQNGYELTAKQLEIKDRIIETFFISSELPEEYLNQKNIVNILLTHYFEESVNWYDSVDSIISRLERLVSNASNEESKRQLTKRLYIVDKLRDKTFAMFLLHYIRNGLRDMTNDASPHRHVWLLKKVREVHYGEGRHISILFWKDVLSHAMKNPQFNKEGIEQEIARIHREDSENELTMLDKIKLVYKKPDIFSMLQETPKYEKDYVLEARIKVLQEKVNNYLDNTEYPEERAKIEHIINNALKNSLNNYFNVEEAFRDNLKSDNGKTAKELLEENLVLIEKNILSISESINKKRLNYFSRDTKVNEKYLSGLK